MTRPTITEIPNPAYIKDQKQRRQFMPYRGSILSTQSPAQPSLKEQIQEGYRRYEVDALVNVQDICDHCPDCSDCSFAKEMRALDRCVRVQRVMGVRK
jgi:hypothetical protein